MKWLYGRQTALRDDLKNESKMLMHKLAAEIQNSDNITENLTASVQTLAKQLNSYSGRKNYKYLPMHIKPSSQEIYTRSLRYHWFEKFCKRNDFPFRDIHSLRHFYASALINEGIDVATVSSALGHSAISTTTSIYLHAFQDANARASEAIANVLDFSKKETPPPDHDGREKKIRLTKTSYGKSEPGKKAFSGQ